jgi:hypothetical protein
MQINLAEVAPADVAGVLPKSGMLYFFFHWHDQDDPEGPDAGLVLYHDGSGQRLERVEAPADMHSGGHFRGIDLIPRLEWTFRSCDGSIEIWDDLEARVAEAQGLEPPWGPAPIHRMLGHPEALQFWDLGEGQQLLLQVSSDCPTGVSDWGPYPETGMMWGDCGRIYYLINDGDLKTRCFGDVWAHLECQ